MSDTIWVAIITGCLTTIPQIIITIINNRKEVKIKSIEKFKQDQLKVIIDFLDSVGGIYSNDGISLSKKSDFQKTSQKLLLYFPSIDINEFNKIFDSTKKWNTSERLKVLQPLLKQLSKSIQEK
ncbi:MAG: hypothetical protein IJ568_05575 [Bacilli bacterium]|nr:hypothetical protein [Bacilli bacterium]